MKLLRDPSLVTTAAIPALDLSSSGLDRLILSDDTQLLPDLQLPSPALDPSTPITTKPPNMILQGPTPLTPGALLAEAQDTQTDQGSARAVIRAQMQALTDRIEAAQAQCSRLQDEALALLRRGDLVNARILTSQAAEFDNSDLLEQLGQLKEKLASAGCDCNCHRGDSDTDSTQEDDGPGSACEHGDADSDWDDGCHSECDHEDKCLVETASSSTSQ